MKQTLLKFIEKYQKYISPDHSIWAINRPPYCRFTPSCSDYMKESIEKKGSLKGLFFGLIRISRCMPWSRGGYDPVKK